MASSLLLCSILFVYGSFAQMPLPWTRELKLTNPVMTGNDILIASTLMSRCDCWPLDVSPSFAYTFAISSAVKQFQTHLHLSPDGIFGPVTANRTLMNFSYDRFDNNQIKASQYNAKYKIFIPVYDDSLRNIQTIGHLMDADNKILLSFETRTHGQSNPPTQVWPNYNDSIGVSRDIAANKFNFDQSIECHCAQQYVQSKWRVVFAATWCDKTTDWTLMEKANAMRIKCIATSAKTNYNINHFEEAISMYLGQTVVTLPIMYLGNSSMSESTQITTVGLSIDGCESE